MKTLRLHEEPETGTAKLLKRAVSFENHIRGIARKADHVRTSLNDAQRIIWLNEIINDANSALAALMAKSC